MIRRATSSPSSEGRAPADRGIHFFRHADLAVCASFFQGTECAMLNGRITPLS